MHPPNKPIFLSNSPSVICDQILWLVKNGNLNFELKETPFSLSLNIKKKFVQHWNPPDSYATQPTATYSHDRGQDPGHVHDAQDPQVVDLINQLKAAKQTCCDVLREKEQIEKDYISVNKSFKKLSM